jgi:hypothetical protein
LRQFKGTNRRLRLPELPDGRDRRRLRFNCLRPDNINHDPLRPSSFFRHLALNFDPLHGDLFIVVDRP